MYTRSFQGGVGDGKMIPEGYDGNAFDRGENTEFRDTGGTLEEKDVEITANADPPNDKQCEPAGLFSGIFGGARSLLGIGRGASLFPHGFGTEEILIIATALFLFFSRDGDRECAVILLLLLIVN